MTTHSDSVYDRTTSGDRTSHQDSSTTAIAREEASRVGDAAQEEASKVVDEAKQQGQELYGEAVDRAKHEANDQAKRAADGLRTLSSELRSMSNAAGEATTPVASWAQTGANTLDSLADTLDRRGVEGIVDEISGFARRNPGTFLAVSFGTGLLAARLGRNLASDNGNNSDRYDSSRWTDDRTAKRTEPLGSYRDRDTSGRLVPDVQVERLDDTREVT